MPCFLSSPLHNIDPIQVDFRDNVAAFYAEGSTVRVVCVNRNVFPFMGDTFWVDPMDMPVGTGGDLEFNALRSLTGRYTCGVMLTDSSYMVDIPTRSFNLAVHCKLLIIYIYSPESSSYSHKCWILYCSFRC